MTSALNETRCRGLVAVGIVLAVTVLFGSAGSAQERSPAPATAPREPASRPAGQRDAALPRPEPTASEVLEMLKPREGMSRPIVRPVIPGRQQRTRPAPAATPPNAVVPVEHRLWPDGYRLVDRPGRLQREGDYWVFAFESRSTQTAEPPIRLLPNRMLEDMEIASAGGTRSVVFLLSGEVTEYHGVNYLLVQKMLIRPDFGNLK